MKATRTFLAIVIVAALGVALLSSPAQAHDFNPLPVGVYKICLDLGCSSFGQKGIGIANSTEYGFTRDGGVSWRRGDYEHPETGSDDHIYWLSGPLAGLETTHGVCCGEYSIFVMTPTGLRTFAMPLGGQASNQGSGWLRRGRPSLTPL